MNSPKLPPRPVSSRSIPTSAAATKGTAASKPPASSSRSESSRTSGSHDLEKQLPPRNSHSHSMARRSNSVLSGLLGMARFAGALVDEAPAALQRVRHSIETTFRPQERDVQNDGPSYRHGAAMPDIKKPQLPAPIRTGPSWIRSAPAPRGQEAQLREQEVRAWAYKDKNPRVTGAHDQQILGAGKPDEGRWTRAPQGDASRVDKDQLKSEDAERLRLFKERMGRAPSDE